MNDTVKFATILLLRDAARRIEELEESIWDRSSTTMKFKEWFEGTYSQEICNSLLRQAESLENAK